MVPFRLHHLYTLLNELYTTPIGEVNRVALYFKQHRSLGSKDRQWMSTRIFAILRHRRLLEALIQQDNQEVTPETLVAKVEEGALDNIEKYQDFPWPVRYSISDDLAECLIEDYGQERAKELSEIFLQEAPCAIRVNTRRTSVEDLQKCLEYPSEPGSVPGSLRFDKRYPLQHSAAFHRGLFEVQDESSQKITLDIPISKKDRILDFCAGAGGKSLIFAERAHHVVLHDSRKDVLDEAKQRLRRAGIRNFSIGEQHLRRNSFSIVVVDAPCTGTGVFRRYPEKKSQFSKKLLITFSRVQRKILREAMNYVKPGGKLVYITCSLLSEENEKQVAFMKSLGWEEERHMHTALSSESGDGFFSAHFVRKSREASV
ncbi:Ribosomal RNA small subunit methyltransferase B,16S rRNA methyltransferase B,tRNA and rRNA cytosine-C5-methylases,ribosomal RNA small subunit methyltransferase B,NOL1/NOP2/sun family [Chlamydia poikilotherma]|uniref:Ribosomal RNA small subunit methyltransferase B,16S rRNA methyltransferase B,tRNA and rRNA cytosine-C5-methylases,ribosomal RNA small subunit methyltransferase B,NOL1/NOP2/sun family n=1 Tax=Chlamydia poikilotherma TaxID=1967783 RepID=A0A3B0PQU1_9CHLA|nr:RsmB/NOP family class I SAM-dependent RNA methyltransferase [Chlamydia poikilotherma]SYX08558.1 Ribosomal RNA small subunit methyltransferase B,16S rRNA methyltransferase B,tRNA and rRNA cytosine-C5-methylases,ribosomal RNA small subunit methyltransferase B,NOL1/NOP2/sun family [Chlamydia poikilotherma]